MKKGEKILSFVKYEKEIESEYRKALDSTKRPEEIFKVFREYAFKVIKSVKEDVEDKMIEEIDLVVEEDNPVYIGEELLESLGDEIAKKSDLIPILKRMAESAVHRYVKLKKDDERTDMFRLGDKSKIH